MRRLIRLLLALGTGAVPLLVLTPPAAATIDGPCEATGTFLESGDTHSAEEAEVTIPLSDTVQWSASIPGGDASGQGPERPIKGQVELDTPFGTIGLFGLGEWDSTSSSYSNRGDYDYSFPSVAGGATVTLTGEHFENGVLTCSGEITITLEGGGFSNPLTWLSLGLMAFAGAGFIISFF